MPTSLSAVFRAVAALTFTFAALIGTATAQLVNGGSVSGAITSIGGQDSYSFSAQAGDYVVLRLVDDVAGPFRPVLEILHPNGTQVEIDVDATVSWIEFAAQSSGTYQALVRDGNSNPVTGAYTIYYVRAPGANEGGTLPNGGSVDGTLDAGDLDSYTFSMIAGENYVLRFADSALSSIYARMILISPSGALVAADGDATVAWLAGAAGTTGTYTVVVMDGTSSPIFTGNYTLHLVRAPGANEGGTLPSGSKVSGSLTIGDLDSYTFDMIAGESYLLHAVDVNFTSIYMRMDMFDPMGNHLADNGDANVAALFGDAPITGTYTVVVSDGTSSPLYTGAYEVHFVRVPGATSGGALTSGSPTTGTIDVGEFESFTFAVEAGENFLLRAADTTASSLYMTMRLYDPRGCFVTSDGDASVAALSGVAGFTGDYTVVISDGSSSPQNTADYTLYFTRVPGANSSGELPNGGTATGTLEQGEVESFSFEIEAGTAFAVRMTDVNATSLYPTMSLYDPRGTFVAANGNSTVSQLWGTAQFSGAYTLAIFDGNSSPTFTGDFEVRLVTMPGANEHGYLLDGVPATEFIDVGDLDSYTFLATAGDSVSVTMTDLLATSLYPSIAVYAPNGQEVTSGGGATTVTRAFTAPFDGTYTIVAYDGSSNAPYTGDYSLELTGSGMVGNSGCDRLGKVQFSAATSAATGFSILAPETSQTFSTPPFLALGSPLPQTVLLPNGVSCGVCGLDVFNVFLIQLAPIVIAPLSPATVGTTLTAQTLFLNGSCIELSAASTFTIQP